MIISFINHFNLTDIELIFIQNTMFMELVFDSIIFGSLHNFIWLIGNFDRYATLTSFNDQKRWSVSVVVGLNDINRDKRDHKRMDNGLERLMNVGGFWQIGPR